MTQIPYPFKFSLSTPLDGPFFVHGVQLDFVQLDNGTRIDGRLFSEFQDPKYLQPYTTTRETAYLVSDARMQDSRLIDFDSPPNCRPNWASPLISITTTSLIVWLPTCSHAIFLALDRLSTAARDAAHAAHAAAIAFARGMAPFLTDGFLIAATDLDSPHVLLLGSELHPIPRNAFEWDFVTAEHPQGFVSGVSGWGSGDWDDLQDDDVQDEAQTNVGNSGGWGSGAGWGTANGWGGGWGAPSRHRTCREQAHRHSRRKMQLSAF
ncbi:hypothetical protein DFH07DRAFT_971921 [Mycena maculata]|uniref:Uncharacterized protein n=1 Tax=Mycena maculata TaxID=230809 RepID=A0AAD7MLC5_9AGAR|nr:hypothetical protein DFH07DRAFT_971921 [Mycena maculata]